MMSGATHEWAGITYTSLAGPRSNSTAFDRYCADSARMLYKHIETVRPAIVHAASNYLNALPALIAAQAGRCSSRPAEAEDSMPSPITSSGPAASARTMPIRCRWPPLNSCG